MKQVKKTIEIKAPKSKVWEVMLGKDTYSKWTTPFGPDPSGNNTSIAVTDWKEGSDVKFLDSTGGMGVAGTIKKHIPAEIITMEYYGIVGDGKVLTEGPDAKPWIGAVEEYKISEKDGVSHLEISVDMDDSYYDMMMVAWDKALAILKELSEK